MSAKCVKCPFVTAPEEMDEHMNLCHRSTRSVTQALLRSPSLGKHKEANSSVRKAQKNKVKMLLKKKKRGVRSVTKCLHHARSDDTWKMSTICQNFAGATFVESYSWQTQDYTTIAARNTQSTSSPITNVKFANIRRWTNTTWVNTQRDNMLETAWTVLCATCVMQGSQILTCWRNTCNSMSRVFAKSVTSSSTRQKI